MIRDISRERKDGEIIKQDGCLDSDEDLVIPKPTFATGGQDSESNSPTEECKEEKEKHPFMPSLADNCIKIISNNLCIENALEMLQNADHNNIEELKINCLKFIALNIVSFLESSYLEKIYQLPVYLIRELENFLKIHSINKFKYFSMLPFEEVVSDALEH